MTRVGVGIVLGFSLCIAGEVFGAKCYAEPQEQRVRTESPTLATIDTSENSRTPKEETFEKQGAHKKAAGDRNTLGPQFARNLLSDQGAIWTSSIHLRWADGTWLFPLTAATGGFFATDRAATRALSNNPSRLRAYRNFSNYGLYSLVGAGGSLYLWSKISRDDRQRETGLLAGEAAMNSFAVDTAFKYSFGRERPDQGQGLGHFFQHGSSFPSDHSAIAWSIASVMAHEYPGPLAKLLAYGMATAVSVSRVGAKEHFPSDVAVGAAVGWLIGRQVYRAHHDPELGGSVLGSLSGNEAGEDHRDRHNMGSPFIPLDSWVYPALEKLAALGYIHTAILGQKPWTRIECARLTDEAGGAPEEKQALTEEAAGIRASLREEFAYEIGLLDGGRNLTANLDSVYARSVSISGPPLSDGYHFGQTISYDYGRPFERGENGQAGGSFSAAAGPLAISVRAEYQHAPSAPATSNAILQTISTRDGIPLGRLRSGPLATVNQAQLLDAYATVNISNWQIVVGKQSLSWAPYSDGSMLWNTNFAPINMVRLVNPEPFRLPGILQRIGPVRIDQFFGRLDGGIFISRPFIYGQKLNFQPFSWLELGIGRTTTIGGKGGEPLTPNSLLHSVFGVVQPSIGGVPGDNESEMDWTLYLPKVRNYLVLYGDSHADDDILPVERPARNPWHPGIFITRIPGMPKLDFRVEGVWTDAPGRLAHMGNGGELNYWNGTYRDGNTTNGWLIGNTVGRDGKAIQGWLRYWISPRDTAQFIYRYNTVAGDFIPGGGAWQDYGFRNEIYLRNGFYAKTDLQYEHISHYPLLFKGPEANLTAIFELGFIPERAKSRAEQ
jgi:membrane-associated phospholipid phosphatase